MLVDIHCNCEIWFLIEISKSPTARNVFQMTAVESTSLLLCSPHVCHLESNFSFRKNTFDKKSTVDLIVKQTCNILALSIVFFCSCSTIGIDAFLEFHVNETHSKIEHRTACVRVLYDDVLLTFSKWRKCVITHVHLFLVDGLIRHLCVKKPTLLMVTTNISSFAYYNMP